MNTHFAPSGKAESLHTFAVPLPISPKANQESKVSFISTKLNRSRFIVSEAVQPFFNKKVIFNSEELSLKGERFLTWNKILNTQLIHLTKKASEIRYKNLLLAIEAERLHQYLLECRKKLKENFLQFYLELS